MDVCDTAWAPSDWIVPDWPAPAGVRAVMTTRSGGVSAPPWGAAPALGGGMNLGLNSGDEPASVHANRARLPALLPALPQRAPAWLTQVHGATVVDAESVTDLAPTADASTAVAAAAVCAVLVADCLPVLLVDAAGQGVAAAHAGWRGLVAGVLQATVTRLRERIGAHAGDAQSEIIAWLGPAIGPARFEVGPEVLDGMQRSLPEASRAFMPSAPGKHHADLFALARQALAQCGVVRVYGGGICTASDAQRFYSFRRDGPTGRHAALIWRQSSDVERGTAGSTPD
ncbi:MAG: peptidoglycan editing factor PgeF [Burkholderiaceae bacterium]|nr:peptidoglycan editing factor PgeF [Burkholderiaceae bacterium]